MLAKVPMKLSIQIKKKKKKKKFEYDWASLTRNSKDIGTY